MECGEHRGKEIVGESGRDTFRVGGSKMNKSLIFLTRAYSTLPGRIIHMETINKVVMCNSFTT